MYAFIIIILGIFLGYFFNNYMWTVIFLVGACVGYIARDYKLYIKSEPKKHDDSQNGHMSLKVGSPIKEGEYHPIYIKIDKNELGGYTSFVYNRHGTHLTKENRTHFVNILHYMILKENELRSHKFKLYTFKKDK